MNEIYEFLKQAGTYYLATAEGDQPHVRPFGTIDVFEGKLYIQTGLSKAVAGQMLKNPRIELCAFREGKWIRVTAEAVHDPNVEAEAHMLDAHPELKPMYKPGDGNTAVFALKNGTAVISSFGAEPETYTF